MTNTKLLMILALAILIALSGFPLKQSESSFCTITGSYRGQDTYLNIFRTDYTYSKSKLEKYLDSQKISYKNNWKVVGRHTNYSNLSVSRGCSRMPAIVHNPYIDTLVELKDSQKISQAIKVLESGNKTKIESFLSELGNELYPNELN